MTSTPTLSLQIGTVSTVDNPADTPYARGAAAGRRLADRLRGRDDWADIFADMRVMVEAARSEVRAVRASQQLPPAAEPALDAVRRRMLDGRGGGLPHNQHQRTKGARKCTH